MFRSELTAWNNSLEEVEQETPTLTLDPTSIASIISNNFVTGDRTLWKEIQRRPWLSRTANNGEVELLPIPPHGLRLRPPREIAGELILRLEHEAMEAVRGRNQIYLLLSGGLDSRVVAGVIRKLEKSGRLPSAPICVTWGTPESRDVLYAQRIAKAFEWQWVHAQLTVNELKHNVLIRTPQNGSLLSPANYHAMSWFDRKFSESVILAASYGDSVGRAEFSGRHLLELAPITLTNPFGLLTPSTFEDALSGLESDLALLRSRTGDRPPYGVLEAQQQSFYMRNLIGLAMSSIDTHATTYQMFTHPDVFQFMWSHHPASRTDDVYRNALEMLDPRLARTPWARTNRSLSGRSEHPIKEATKSYHCYIQWAKELARTTLSEAFDPAWFAETGVFTQEGCNELSREMLLGSGQNSTSRRAAEIWLWMVSLKIKHEMLGAKLISRRPSLQNGFEPIAPAPDESVPRGLGTPIPTQSAFSLLRGKIPTRVKSALKRLRRAYLRWHSLRAFPPKVK